jgi:hypothetical protein
VHLKLSFKYLIETEQMTKKITTAENGFKPYPNHSNHLSRSLQLARRWPPLVHVLCNNSPRSVASEGFWKMSLEFENE